MIPYPFLLSKIPKGEKEMAKVSLTIKTGNVKESQVFEIDRITTFQALKLKTEIGTIMKELKDNGELTNVIEGLTNGQLDITALKPTVEGEVDVTVEEIESLKDQRFINGLAGAFDKLLDTLPERAMNILSIMSGIDRETLEKTYLDELFDVYDAIMQENDIMRIAERIKKSFFGTKNQWGEMIRQMFNKQK
jgi:hypothetical protein